MHKLLLPLAAMAVVFTGGPVYACGWWSCGEGYGYRQPTRVYGYYKSVRPTAPARVPSRLELLSAPPIPGGDSILLLAPGAMPGPGPTLFGPPAAAATYYYNAPPVRRWQRRYR
jgi:hypothetical protein